MRKTIVGIASALAVSTAAALPTGAVAQGIPCLRGQDHVGMTVPNIGEAIDLFEQVIGCKAHLTFGPFRDDEGTFMQDLLNVHPRAVVKQITMVRCGFGSNIELFEYESPDQVNAQPKNSDIGGYHMAFYVDDIDAAVAYLKEKGVTTFLGPLPVQEGPAAGQTINYFLAPWGTQFELISYPNGMAYEQDSDGKLWSPKDPAS